jgi:hypothetical protein
MRGKVLDTVSVEGSQNRAEIKIGHFRRRIRK